MPDESVLPERKHSQKGTNPRNEATKSFEKFTDKARKVLVLAQDEARSLHQPYVGTEHILLGLIQEKDGLAAQALNRLNVSYDGVVQAIRQVVTIDEAAGTEAFSVMLDASDSPSVPVMYDRAGGTFEIGRSR